MLRGEKMADWSDVLWQHSFFLFLFLALPHFLGFVILTLGPSTRSVAISNAPLFSLVPGLNLCGKQSSELHEQTNTHTKRRGNKSRIKKTKKQNDVVDNDR